MSHDTLLLGCPSVTDSTSAFRALGTGSSPVGVIGIARGTLSSRFRGEYYHRGSEGNNNIIGVSRGNIIIGVSREII